MSETLPESTAELEAAERFDPDAMHGSMIEAEHVARYRFASQLVKGRDVLDAGCGLAYGSELLRAAGAAHVTGVDISAETLDRVRAGMPDGVELLAADLRELPFDDASFDAIVCFEAIEHVDPADRVLDELRRVLRRGGVLVISSPNRGVYTEGNPHHVHEFTRTELVEALRARWAHVTAWGQQTWVSSSVLDEASAAARDTALEVADVRKLAAARAGEETYVVALASDDPLPAAQGLVTLTDPIEIRRWNELWQEQRRAIDEQIEHGRTRENELQVLRGRLLAAERRLAELPLLERDLGDLRAAVDDLRQERERLAQERDRAWSYSGIAMNSTSWKITAPLRRLAALLKR